MVFRYNKGGLSFETAPDNIYKLQKISLLTNQNHKQYQSCEIIFRYFF